MLGETIAAATVAVKSGLDEHEALGEVLPIAAGGLLIIFAAWWVYFAVPIHGHLRSSRQSFLWGYGHYLIFVSGAAIGVTWKWRWSRPWARRTSRHWRRRRR